jgi:hypothetical protein
MYEIDPKNKFYIYGYSHRHPLSYPSVSTELTPDEPLESQYLESTEDECSRCICNQDCYLANYPTGNINPTTTFEAMQNNLLFTDDGLEYFDKQILETYARIVKYRNESTVELKPSDPRMIENIICQGLQDLKKENHGERFSKNSNWDS